MDHIILHLMVHLNQKTGLHGSTGFNIKYHADPRGSSTITFFTGAKATGRVAWYWNYKRVENQRWTLQMIQSMADLLNKTFQNHPKPLINQLSNSMPINAHIFWIISINSNCFVEILG